MLPMNIHKVLPNGTQDRQIDHLAIHATNTSSILENLTANDDFIAQFQTLLIKKFLQKATVFNREKSLNLCLRSTVTNNISRCSSPQHEIHSIDNDRFSGTRFPGQNSHTLFKIERNGLNNSKVFYRNFK